MKISREESEVFVLLASIFQSDPRVKQEVDTLINNGFKVTVLEWNRTGSIIEPEKVINLHVKSVKLLHSKKFNKFLYLISALLFQFVILFYGMNLIHKKGQLLVHVNDFNTTLGAVLLKIFYFRKIKLIYDLHEHSPEIYKEWYGYSIGVIIRILEKIFVKFMQTFITVSYPIKVYLKTLTNKKITIIRNYPTKTIIPQIDKKEARNRLQISDNVFVIIYLGSLREDIALIELIESAIYLKNKVLKKTIKFYIIGGGSRYVEIENYIKANDIGDIVFLEGRKPREEALVYLKGSDLSYICFKAKGYNTQIGLPWKLFESLACGTAVIVQEETLAAEMVEKHNAGLILKSLEPKEMVNSILNYVKENSSRKKIVSEMFWENQEDDFINIYESLIKSKQI